MKVFLLISCLCTVVAGTLRHFDPDRPDQSATARPLVAPVAVGAQGPLAPADSSCFVTSPCLPLPRR